MKIILDTILGLYRRTSVIRFYKHDKLGVLFWGVLIVRAPVSGV